MLSYLVLCVRLGQHLPGKRTIPVPYYKALDVADQAIKEGHVDFSAMEEVLAGMFSAMEEVLAGMLANQLLDVYQDATGLVGSGKAGPLQRPPKGED